jgi:hypothetical protein
VTSFEVDATMVGHDLSRGTSQFTRTPKPQPVDETTDATRSEEVAA